MVLNSTVSAQASESSCNLPSNTEIVNEQVAVLPEASVAVQVTVVTPSGKQLPEGGLQTTVTPGQLSVAVVVKFTTVQVLPGAGVTAVRLHGQVMTGAWVSLTLTVNVQLGPAEEVHVTVVVPTGKNKPEAGVQVMVPQPEPCGVGAG